MFEELIMKVHNHFTSLKEKAVDLANKTKEVAKSGAAKVTLGAGLALAGAPELPDAIDTQAYVQAAEPQEQVGRVLASNKGNESKRLETGKLKDGTIVSRKEFIERGIAYGQSKGIIKTQDDFVIEVAKDRIQPNKEAYEAYIDEIKEKADVFDDPVNFGRFLATIRVLKDTKDKRTELPVLLPSEIDRIVSYPNYPVALHYVSKVNGGINTGATIVDARQHLAEFLRKMDMLAQRN